MSNTFSDTIEKKYCLIGEVAGILNEHPSTVRYWVVAFGLEVKKTHTLRHFSKENIADLHRIKYLLRDEKFTLEGAKKKFKATV
ncbi:MAG TPA: MerR family transcriptional regulator [Cyclobacteriaceae bacterium]|nr:MerR family transcriptional regulator [Cyclobacteriaceae bacterium]